MYECIEYTHLFWNYLHTFRVGDSVIETRIINIYLDKFKRWTDRKQSRFVYIKIAIIFRIGLIGSICTGPIFTWFLMWNVLRCPEKVYSNAVDLLLNTIPKIRSLGIFSTKIILFFWLSGYLGITDEKKNYYRSAISVLCGCLW